MCDKASRRTLSVVGAARASFVARYVFLKILIGTVGSAVRPASITPKSATIGSQAASGCLLLLISNSQCDQAFWNQFFLADLEIKSPTQSAWPLVAFLSPTQSTSALESLEATPAEKKRVKLTMRFAQTLGKNGSRMLKKLLKHAHPPRNGRHSP